MLGYGLVGMAVVAALAVGVRLATLRRYSRSGAALRQWASQHSWTYADRPVTGWEHRLPGPRRRVRRVLSGTVDRYPVSVADYTYVEGGEYGGTATLFVVVVRLPWSGPSVEVRPRSDRSRLGRGIDGGAVISIGYEPFDREYRVFTNAPAAAASLIGPALAAEHLGGRLPAWSLQGADLLYFRSGRLDDPDAIPALAAPLVRVAALLGR